MRTGPGAAASFDWMMSLQLKGATVHASERRNQMTDLAPARRVVS